MTTLTGSRIGVTRADVGNRCVARTERATHRGAGRAVEALRGRRGRLLMKGAAALVALLTVALAWRPLMDLLALLRDREGVMAIVQGAGVWGPVLLFLIQFLQVIVAFIPGQPFLVAAGWSYGFLGGLLINVFSTTVASQLAFTLARRAGRPVVNRLVPESKLDRWVKVAEERGSTFFLLVYLVPILPVDTMNFVAGLCSISPRRFLVVNTAGRLPCVILMTLAGSHGLALTPRVWAVIGGVAVCAAGLYLACRHCTARGKGRGSATGGGLDRQPA